MPLPRLPGESREDWVERNVAYFASDAGRAAARAVQERDTERDLSRDLAWLAEMGVPRRPAQAALRRDLRATPAMLAVQDPRPCSLLVLSGGVGCGKSTAAAWWLRGQSPETGFYVAAQALERWPRYDADAMDRLLTPERLVIDDLGTEYKDIKGAYQSLLDQVACARFAAELPTVITTNVKFDDFETRYEARIADRIREDGRFMVVGDYTDSLRGKT